jgi:hypothetical protein
LDLQKGFTLWDIIRAKNILFLYFNLFLAHRVTIIQTAKIGSRMLANTEDTHGCGHSVPLQNRNGFLLLFCKPGTGTMRTIICAARATPVVADAIPCATYPNPFRAGYHLALRYASPSSYALFALRLSLYSHHTRLLKWKPLLRLIIFPSHWSDWMLSTRTTIKWHFSRMARRSTEQTVNGRSEIPSVASAAVFYLVAELMTGITKDRRTWKNWKLRGAERVSWGPRNRATGNRKGDTYNEHTLHRECGKTQKLLTGAEK